MKTKKLIVDNYNYHKSFRVHGENYDQLEYTLPDPFLLYEKQIIQKDANKGFAA